LLGDQFRLTAVASEGIGLTDVTRLMLLLLFRWLLLWPGGYDRARWLVSAGDRIDSRLSVGPLGYHLVVAAERTEGPAT
jgi:hypothetical protein